MEFSSIAVSSLLPSFLSVVFHGEEDSQGIGRVLSTYVSYGVDSADGLRSRDELVGKDGDNRFEG